MEKTKVAIVGLGTVGSGVARLLLDHGDRTARHAGRTLWLEKAVVRDIRRPRDCVVPKGVLTTDLQEVLDDPDIKVVAQLIGGLEPARTIMLQLLEAGKDVVTANKALLAEHGPELFDRARALGRCIAFEAAVAGGIPIITTVSQCFSANQVESLQGILNGTSNFIVSKMDQLGWSYEQALSEAQRLGFAEADPTMDVDGTDAAQKLAILAHLAFGARIRWDKIPKIGIDTLDSADLRFAKELGYRLKLIAHARLDTAGLELSVAPTLIRIGHPLAEVRANYNAINVVGDAVGDIFLHGQGAGQMPTASAVVADMIDTAVGRTPITFRTLELWSNRESKVSIRPFDDLPGRYYMRFQVADQPGVMASITTILGEEKLSIASIIQHEPDHNQSDSTVQLVIMTHEASEGAAQGSRADNQVADRGQQQRAYAGDGRTPLNPRVKNMKYAIVIPDGCSDVPMPELDGQTPLEVARIPNMDEVAALGMVAQTDNVPAHLPAGSEVANMTLFGYDPNQYFTGRAPIEAAAQGIELGESDWAVRCNLVTIVDQIMVDFTAGHISTEEAKELLQSLSNAVNDTRLEFVPGVSYRNLLIYRGRPDQPSPFSGDTRTRAPHDLTDLPVSEDYPRGPGSDLLTDLMQRSEPVFASHAVNVSRRSAGEKAATNVWLWGQGKSPSLPSFGEKFGLRGAMITAVDLLRGLAALIGWDRIEVEGATGYLDTNYAGKGQAAVAALDKFDIVCVHVEATDEASHEGRYQEKIKALEAIDEHVVGPVHEKLKSLGDYRLLVLPDHPTPCSTKKHSHGMVPLAVCGENISGFGDSYSEKSAAESPKSFPNGWEMMECFIRGSW